MYPTVTEHSRGSRLWDLNGNEYIDIVNGFGSTVFGHAHDFVVNVVRSQLDRGFEIGPQSPSAGRVAAMLCDTTGMERATICNTGSEAVMACIRVARCVTGRSRIVTFSGAYHSIFDEVLATASSLRWIEEHAKELAGVLVEPVQSRHSDLQPKEFLHELRCITKKSGCALIFDEGTTGFRVHPGGVQAIFDIRPTLRRTEKCWAAACRLAHSPGVRSSWMPWTGATGAMATTLLRIEASLSLVGRLSAILYPLRPPSRLRPFAETGPGPAGKAERDDGPACGGTELLFQRGRFASLLFYHLRANGVYMREGYPCFLTSAHTEGEVNNIAEICSIDR